MLPFNAPNPEKISAPRPGNGPSVGKFLVPPAHHWFKNDPKPNPNPHANPSIILTLASINLMLLTPTGPNKKVKS